MADLNSGLTDVELVDAVNKANDISSTAAAVDGAVTHSEAAHAPADADNTASNETSHTNVVVDANYVATEESYTTVEKSKAALTPVSDITGVTGADAITNMMSLTQAEYDAIGSPDASTFYLIVE